MFKNNNVESIKGNISDLNAVIEATKNVDTIVHAVSPNIFNSTQKQFYSSIVTGTENIINASKINSVKNIIHISSTSVTNNLINCINQNEEYPLPDEYLFAYDKTKRLSEDIMLSSNSNDLKICALRPCVIISSHKSYGVGPLFKLKKFTMVPNFSNKVDCGFIDDLNDAIQNALVNINKTNGKAYFVSGIPCQSSDLALSIAKIMGWDLRRINMDFLKRLSTGSQIFREVRQLFQKDRPISFKHIMEMANSWKTFDQSLAKKDFNYKINWNIDDIAEYVVDD